MVLSLSLCGSQTPSYISGLGQPEHQHKPIPAWWSQDSHTCHVAVLSFQKESFKRPRGTPQSLRNITSAHSVEKADHKSWPRLKGKRTVLSLSVGGVTKPRQPSLISHICSKHVRSHRFRKVKATQMCYCLLLSWQVSAMLNFKCVAKIL